MIIINPELQEEYDGECGKHPSFSVEDWQRKVAADDTRNSY
jgi:hypothetical protein